MIAEPPFDLRDGSLDDLDDVMAVMGDSFDSSFGEAWTAPQCAGLLPMPGVWLRLARDGAGVIGFAMSRVVAGEAELLLLAVKSEAQGRGAGNALLSDFVQCAAARGARRVHLEVRDGNRALDLYSKGGFSPVGRRRNYYSGRDGQIYDALTLARSVD